jgi:type I restriction enzyme R subunit
VKSDDDDDDDDDMRTVALFNERTQYELVPADKFKEMLVERHEKNGHLCDLYFANPTSSG